MILFESNLKSTIDNRSFVIYETNMGKKLNYQIDYPTIWHNAVGETKDWDGTLKQQETYRDESYEWLTNQVENRIKELTEFKKALDKKIKEKADKQLTLGLTGT